MNTTNELNSTELLAGNVEFIRSLPGPSGPLEVKVRPLRFLCCLWWHRNVQWRIDESYRYRVDEGWNWPLLYIMTKLSTPRFPVYGIAILGRWTPDDVNEYPLDDYFLPMGMAIVVRNYPHLSDHFKKSEFLWYLSSLPKPLFSEIGFDDYKAVGRGVIDTVLCDAFKNWLLGVVSLHADPAGGEELLKWYSTIGMKRIDKKIKIPKPRGFLKKNDGRYFCYLPTENIKAYLQLQEWR